MSVITEQSMLQAMELHKEMAAGEIRVHPDTDASSVGFADLMKQKVATVNADQNFAGAKTAAVEMGQSDDLVGAMVASQKASLSFSAMVQIRNRLVSALDELLKMPL
ncbi:flagellar hook-basal body complex protein FliE [Ferrimonas aestuarii]|uniref:Flagellar hook-basal body complex protein FliE n=1 Tax=Ferrimonas aestuarii TaxID=2569539 RepID=A0A4U1BMP4_9GAMM|nr:flagellar hook-basal body complex protein FliE [Ferrimonas aestuarii]TKB54570.1 flagellar hook-basal body complex protein FliE [Ferrimonas aestuarii]